MTIDIRNAVKCTRCGYTKEIVPEYDGTADFIKISIESTSPIKNEYLLCNKCKERFCEFLNDTYKYYDEIFTDRNRLKGAISNSISAIEHALETLNKANKK